MRRLSRRHGYRRVGAYSAVEIGKRRRFARLEKGACPAAARAKRDDSVGFHQSRHATRAGGNPEARRGLFADGLPALPQQGDSRRPGSHQRESAEGQNADRRRIRQAARVQGQRAKARGLPLLADWGPRPEKKKGPLSRAFFIWRPEWWEAEERSAGNVAPEDCPPRTVVAEAA